MTEFPLSLSFPWTGFRGCLVSDATSPPWPGSSRRTGASPRREPADSTATTLTGILPSSSQPCYQLHSHKKSFQLRICFPSRFPEETRGPRGSQKWRMLLEPHCQGAGRRTRSLTARRSHISCTYLGKLIGIGSCSFV